MLGNLLQAEPGVTCKAPKVQYLTGGERLGFKAINSDFWLSCGGFKKELPIRIPLISKHFKKSGSKYVFSKDYVFLFPMHVSSINVVLTEFSHIPETKDLNCTEKIKILPGN